MILGERQNKAYVDGDVEDAPILCGQAIGLIHEILTVKEIVVGIISEAKGVGQRLHNLGVF